ncbi:hypothetical protein NCLIV_034660 [Neospora caninum Liverpool]|uniref:Phosphodiesterase n=1 Tax=Neospora caninum (strain Liverpool) TaxID=572307 RepID=F0VIX3_NEOCL|nr:hypothetical protein NCLIV_034660 [Neospora caninum Liverpool]CBZ53684.1 hypothetical protein NCLIV_034660 [Neospora caninum Liverpool]CEL67675.1 TPA: 3',5'-cyclic-nucleotide phosphodiesterase regA [Neospora caninum Liverpool]|eukprot:XP_003883716.1 hypothetical protein NCLIV_034660 [Neospora caninum Liverpool]
MRAALKSVEIDCQDETQEGDASGRSPARQPFQPRQNRGEPGTERSESEPRSLTEDPVLRGRKPSSRQEELGRKDDPELDAAADSHNPRFCERNLRVSRSGSDGLRASPERHGKVSVHPGSPPATPKASLLGFSAPSPASWCWILQREGARGNWPARAPVDEEPRTDVSICVERSGRDARLESSVPPGPSGLRLASPPFLPSPSPAFPAQPGASAPQCPAEIPHEGADCRRRLFAAPFSSVPPTGICSPFSDASSLFSHPPFGTMRSTSSVRESSNTSPKTVEVCSTNATSGWSSFSPVPSGGSVRTPQHSRPGSDDDANSGRTDSSLGHRQMWLLPPPSHSLSSSSRECRLPAESSWRRPSDAPTSDSDRSKRRGRPEGKASATGERERGTSDAEHAFWASPRRWDRGDERRSDSGRRSAASGSCRVQGRGCFFRLGQLLRRSPLAPAQTFDDEDETLYVEGVLRFSRYRSIPVAVAVLVISFLYTLPFVLHGFEELHHTPSAERRIFVFFSSRPPGGSALDAAASERGVYPVRDSDYTAVVLSLVFWILSLGSVFVFACFAIFAAFVRRIEKVLCWVTAVHFTALACAECFQALRTSACPDSFLSDATQEAGGCTRVDSGLTPELLIMQVFFLIVLDFVFCVRLKTSQWLHLCAVSLLLALAVTYTVALPLPAYLVASLWGQFVIGCFVLSSLLLAALALETERRRTFLHCQQAKARVAELQERAQTDKNQGKVAVLGLIHTLKQMDACLRQLQNLAPDASDVVCQLDTLRLQCLGIATSSENFYAVNVDFLPTDVRDVLHLAAQDSSEDEAFRNTQILLGDSLSPRFHSGTCLVIGSPPRNAAAQSVSPLHSRKMALLGEMAAAGRVPGRRASCEACVGSSAAKDKETGEKEKAKPVQVPPLVEHELLSHVGSFWPLDIFKIDRECNGNALLHVGYHLLDPLLAAGFLSCSRGVVLEFLYSLQCLYNGTPYHNQIHAAAVAHMALSVCYLLDLFHPTLGASPSEGSQLFAHQLALIVAALGHDVGHPGRSNAFLIQSSSTLSVVYNDRSILENYHACLTFYTLSHRTCNIFRGKTVTQYRDIRKKVIELILSTDMSHHFEFATRIAARRENPDFNFREREEDRALVLSLAIKVADLGHCAVDWEAHAAWSARLKEEFFAQGDEEQRLGLPVSPLCDRSQQGQLPRSQANFIEFLFLPLAQHVAAIAPDDRFERTAIARARQNIFFWESRQADIDANNEE